jgi:hypothetical protein
VLASTGQLTATAWSISLYASPNALSPGGTSTVTAYTNMDVGPTPWWIEIYESTNAVFLGRCGGGTSCSVYPSFPYATSRNYLAFVSDYSASWTPTNIQATSNYANVTWYAVSLSASPTSLVAWSWTTLTASATNDVGPTPYYLEIYDRNTGGRVANCASGWQCSVSIQQTGATTRTYVAYVAGLGTTNPPPSSIASSNIATVSWAALSVSLSASSYWLAPGVGSTLTASANTNVGPTPYWIELFEADTGRYLYQCASGTICQVGVSYGYGVNHTYIAYISGNSTSFPPSSIAATSNSFAIVWLNVWISASATYLQVGNQVIITATANADITYAPYAIEIYDQDNTLQNNTARLAICTTGSVCTTGITYGTALTRRFVAVIAYSGGNYPPPGVQSNSGTAYVTWVYVTLSADLASLAPGSWSTLTANTSVLAQNTPYALQIFEVGGAQQAWCTTGSSCQTRVKLDAAGARNFIAYLAPYTTAWPVSGVVAASSVQTVTWLSVTLSVSSTTPVIAASISLTATANGTVTTPWTLMIFDETTGVDLNFCTNCQTVSWGDTQYAKTTHTYVAAVATYSATWAPPNSQAVSAAIPVTWDVDHVWGVDSADPITAAFVQSIQRFGQPHFFGRYLGPDKPTIYSGLVQAEVDFAHANNIKIMPIDASLSLGLTGQPNGYNEAVRASGWLHGYSTPAPAGTIIYLDVEQGASIDSAFVQGWYDGMASTGYGYLPGYYNNPVNGNFTTALCGASAAVKQNAYLWSSQPNPGEATEANAPTFNPTRPGCAALSTITAWQFGIHSNQPLDPNVKPDTGNFDTDEIRPGILPNMW